MTFETEYAAAELELANARADYDNAFKALPEGSTHRAVALNALQNRISIAARAFLRLEDEDRLGQE